MHPYSHASLIGYISMREKRGERRESRTSLISLSLTQQHSHNHTQKHTVLNKKRKEMRRKQSQKKKGTQEGRKIDTSRKLEEDANNLQNKSKRGNGTRFFGIRFWEKGRERKESRSSLLSLSLSHTRSSIHKTINKSSIKQRKTSN